jgi:NADPH-dependent 2,4-dienoyl-CoA reductase/sulfur reductase-like enzyme
MLGNFLDGELRRLQQATGNEMPLVAVGRRVLCRPSVAALRTVLGPGARSQAGAEALDLLVVGAGPAGMAAAVYRDRRACQRR